MIHMSQKPLVDIIIPHYNGKEILYNCLYSLDKMTYPNAKIWVVDNGSTDDSVSYVKSQFDWVNVLHPGENLGYAGGCNFGVEKTTGKYLVFLNNDTEQEPEWLDYLVEFAEKKTEIAALQPKLLSIQNRNQGKRVFDYAGAAGGMVDHFGYPYAYGRIMNETEEDKGQYDEPREIFWASGAAMFVRRLALEKLGAFDDDFFAHMEEIDLCWRFQLAGYKVHSVPKAIVYHYGGATLKSGSVQKVYLNHRNNLFMLLKNMEGLKMLAVMPLRLLLEMAAGLFYAFKFQLNYSIVPIQAVIWNILNLNRILKKRREIQSYRQVRDRIIFSQSKCLVLFK